MELEHRFTVPAPIDVAWDAFNDLERIAPCFPGAALTSYDGDTFEGLVKVKLGPISLQYKGTGQFLERDADAHRAVIEAKGKDRRGNGTAAANVMAQLTASGDETEVQVKTDLAVTGRPAQFGRGVMQDVSNKLLGQFASCLEQKLASRGEPAGDEAADQPAADQPAADEPAEDEAADQPAADQPAADQPAADEPVGAVPGEAAETGAAAPTPSASGTSGAGSNGTLPSAATSGSAATDVPRQPTPSSSAAAAASPTRAPAAEPEAAELDLGATVLPVLLKRYAPYLVGLVAVLVVLRLVRRRR